MNPAYRRLIPSGIWLTSLPVLLTVFLPRTPVLGSHFFVYGMIPIVLGLYLVASLDQHSRLDRRLVSVWGWLAGIALVTILSQLANTATLLSGGLFRLVRPLLYAIVVTYGFMVGRRARRRDISRALLWAAYAVLLGEAVVGALQMMSVDVLGLVYSMEKVSSWRALFRITGTMGNPNLLAWVVLQATVIILIFSSSKGRYVWMLLGGVLILGTGSRSILLLFPATVLLTEWIASYRSRGKISGVIIALMIASAVGSIIFFMADYFPYISQLENIYNTSSITAVSSMEARVTLWSRVSEAYREGGELVWLLGLSDRTISQTLDNDFLYVLFRNGIVGFTVHISFILYLFSMFKSGSTDKLRELGFAYLTAALVLGMVAETMAGWFVPIWIMFFLGLKIGVDQSEAQKAKKMHSVHGLVTS